MEAIKWAVSAVIGLIVVSVVASAAFAVASFMFVVQVGGGLLLLALGLATGIKEYLFGSKDK